MGQRDWFSVGARLIGLWILTVAVSDLRSQLDVLFGLYRPANTSYYAFFVGMVVHSIAGGYLLVGGDHLASIIFRRNSAA
ncbi:MAG TPA: hypothetical protein VFG11_04200 [Acidobacteriota bacterium]|nr:hypothetical protein [Acidobacteriota bacterium]